MKTAYLAIAYYCNQRCRFCPCSREEASFPSIKLEELKKIVGQFINQSGIEAIVISGGEPTLHPDFLEFMKFLKETGLYVTILSNAEKFSDSIFVEKFYKNISKERFMVTTTLHSQNPLQHEWVNQTKGSFERSVTGLKNLASGGIPVTVKHCINKLNAPELWDFYKFVNMEFPEEVDIQLCSIDYCGLSEKEKTEQMVSFPAIAEYFEAMFDEYLADMEKGSQRNLYCINMPLCSADPYYWDFFTKRSDNYIDYASPEKEGASIQENEVEANVGTFCSECEECLVKEICTGTYKTAFEYYGNKIVKKYTE